jgi:hypothetical protein
MTARQESSVSAGQQPAPGFDSVRAQARVLSRADKYRLVQAIVADLARDDGLALTQPEREGAIAAQHNSHEAAEVLCRMLEDEQARPCGEPESGRPALCDPDEAAEIMQRMLETEKTHGK